MKRYLESIWTWVWSAVAAIVAFLAMTFIMPAFYSALVGVLAGVLFAFILSFAMEQSGKKFYVIAHKYAKKGVHISEPVRVVGIKGQKVNLPAHVVLTDDGVLMVLLENQGFRFAVNEDHSFIYVEKNKHMLLAKSGCDVQLASGALLNNLSFISTGIAAKGFRIERREHAPY